MSEQSTLERVKWYTLARKFPQLIGRTPDGARIPGGPYTITQAVGGLIVLIFGYYSMGVWAGFGVLGNYTVLLSVTGAVVFGLGRIPLGARSPASIGVGVVRAVTAPQRGRLRGRPVRIRRPRKLTQRVVMCTEITTVAPPAAAPETCVASLVKDLAAEPAVVVNETPAPVGQDRAPVAAGAAPAKDPGLGLAAAAPAPAEGRLRRRFVPADRVSPPGVVRGPRPTRRAYPAAPQLTGVQALLASIGTAPEGK